MRARGPVIALLAGVVLVAGCGDDDDGGSDRPTAASGATETTAESGGPAKASASVDIKDFKFVPATVTVKQGGKVTWTNQDSAPHNAENASEKGPAEFKTKTPLNKGVNDTVTFSKPGTYRYYCIYHRFMEADVIVK